MNRIPKKGLFVCAFIVFWIILYYVLGKQNHLRFYAAMIRIPSAILGIYLGCLATEHVQLKKSFYIVLAIMLILGFAYLYGLDFLDFPIYVVGWNALPGFMVGLPLVVFIPMLCDAIKNTLKQGTVYSGLSHLYRAVVWIGTMSLEWYLTQNICYDFVYKKLAAYSALSGFVEIPEMKQILTFLFTLLLSMGIHFITSKIYTSLSKKQA